MRRIGRRGFLALIVLSGPCDRSASRTLSVNKITFLTRPGCVNSGTMRGRLDVWLSRLGLATDYQVIDLTTLPASDPRRGYPTPTVLYDGHDLFGLPESAIPRADVTGVSGRSSVLGGY